MARRQIVFWLALCALLLLGVCATDAPRNDDSQEVEAAHHGPQSGYSGGGSVPGKRSISKLVKRYQENTKKRLGRHGRCNRKNIKVRKEWGNMTPSERRDWISAMKCVRKLPSRSPPGTGDGIRNAYDDFVATHSINTKNIHFNGVFLPWHREFLWKVEQLLRHECGYDGYMPYWDWSKYVNVPVEKNPIWDGSSSSLGGNGTFDAVANTTCISSGPFKDWTVNIGPVIRFLGPLPAAANPQPDGLGYNPICIERAFNNSQLIPTNTYEGISNLIRNNPTPDRFFAGLDGFGGPHGQGHFFIGGTQFDLFVSPGDPAFFLHHAMLDRVWAIWQAQDFVEREYAINNIPENDANRAIVGWEPAEFATPDTKMPFGPVWEDVALDEGQSITKGRYCYIYD